MPKMEWKLKDPKHCNECNEFHYFWYNDKYGCKKFKHQISLNFIQTIFRFLTKRTPKIKRPQSCIDKFGE
jgi:hypothetical protein